MAVSLLCDLLKILQASANCGDPAAVSCQIVRTLCLFLTPTERKCSRLCRADSSFKYDTGLLVQGLLKVLSRSLTSFSGILNCSLDCLHYVQDFFVVWTRFFFEFFNECSPVQTKTLPYANLL